GAIQVIYAPAAGPAAVGRLRATDEVDRPPRLRVVGVIAVVAERFEHAGGDVRAARVEHGVVVGERDVFEDLAIDVAVESRPAPVAVLHGAEPGQAPLSWPVSPAGET